MILDRYRCYAAHIKTSYTVAAAVVTLIVLTGCGGSAGSPSESPTVLTEGDAGITDAPSPTGAAAVAPTTTVTSCKIANDLPVAEVRVANTTGTPAVFRVEVQFTNGDTVLGTGLEYTQELEPNQNQMIRMGSMQGDAKAVDTCKVIAASATD